MITWLPYLLSVHTIATILLAGYGHSWTWRFGLAGQIPWAIYVFSTEAWGFSMMVLATIAAYTFNEIRR